MPVALEDVSFFYKSNDGSDIPALRDVSLTINDGEFVGIMGRTGCGKTTLIQLMAGLMAPASGKVMLDERDINEKSYERSELRKALSFLFQFPDYQLFESTVEKDVAFALKHSALEQDEINERVKWALETMGFPFEAIRSQSPLSLSGGEKRRVAIAGALVTKPRFLIFDEPITGLDPRCCKSFLQTVSRLNSEGTTIIMVSHNSDALGEYAKRLLVFDNGRIALDGDVKDIFSDIERLKELHLNAGTPRTIADMLIRRGFNIPHTATSYAELLHSLKSQLTGGISQ